MKILVTGGSGYIGSVTVKRLIERGYDVTVFDNLERGHRANVDSSARLIVGDLRNAAEIEAALQDVRPDAVMHFAAYALVGESMANPMMYFHNNVGGGVNLLSAMENAECRRLIFSSTCATYGQPETLPIEETMSQCPTNPYGQSKLAFEQMAGWLQATRGFKPTFLRYFNACGAVGDLGEDHDPETHIIPNVLRVALGQCPFVQVFGNDYPTKDGTCVRDYVHIDDLAIAHILALEKEKLGAFNLGTGKGISVMEIIEASRRITNQTIPIKICPRRSVDPAELYASGCKAREDLGWNPVRSDVETIIHDAWEFHRSHPNGLGS